MLPWIGGNTRHEPIQHGWRRIQLLFTALLTALSVVSSFPLDDSIIVLQKAPYIHRRFYSSDALCKALYPPGTLSEYDLIFVVSLGAREYQYSGIYMPFNNEWFEFGCWDMKTHFMDLAALSPPQKESVEDFWMKCPFGFRLKMISAGTRLWRPPDENGIRDWVDTRPQIKAICYLRAGKLMQLVRETIRDCVDYAWPRIRAMIPDLRTMLEIVAFVEVVGQVQQNMKVEQMWLIPLLDDFGKRDLLTMTALDSSSLSFDFSQVDFGVGYRACSYDSKRSSNLNIAAVGSRHTEL